MPGGQVMGSSGCATCSTNNIATGSRIATQLCRTKFLPTVKLLEAIRFVAKCKLNRIAREIRCTAKGLLKQLKQPIRRRLINDAIRCVYFCALPKPSNWPEFGEIEKSLTFCCNRFSETG